MKRVPPSKAQRACTGKVAYPTREVALRAMFAVVRNRGSDVRRLEVYRCRHGCRVGDSTQRAWHFGHRPAWR